MSCRIRAELATSPSQQSFRRLPWQPITVTLPQKTSPKSPYNAGKEGPDLTSYNKQPVNGLQWGFSGGPQRGRTASNPEKRSSTALKHCLLGSCKYRICNISTGHKHINKRVIYFSASQRARQRARQQAAAFSDCRANGDANCCSDGCLQRLTWHQRSHDAQQQKAKGEKK